MILCCGEALIDMLPRAGEAGEVWFAPHAGGAVFNTAIALGRLGAPAGLLSGLGSDFFGDMLRRRLVESRVDASLAVTSDRPTTLAFVQLSAGQASYAFFDENSAGRMLAAEDLPTLPDHVTALFFGGISLVAEPCADAYATLAEREASARLIMLDPNIRPGFIRDAGRYRARLARMIALADLVKLSDEDLEWLEGPGDIAALAGRVLARGPKAVFVTRGARGASAHTRRGVIEVPARRVTVADTVGAGDTFNAGILAALHRAGALTKADAPRLSDELLHAALDLGVRAAAVTVARPGANPPWEHEV